MGYYSDVRVSTTREGFEFLKKYTTHDLFGGYGYVEDVNDDDGVVFGWNAVKWYWDFEEVAEFRNLLFVLEDKGIPWEYLEVGEDNATEFTTCCHDFGNSFDRREFNEQLVHHIEPVMRIVVWNL